MGLLLLGPQALGANNHETLANSLTVPFTGAGQLSSKSPMRAEGISASFLGVVTDVEFYGGFADANGNGRDDLLILLDHERTCAGDLCDFYVFELVVENREIDYACDWRLVDDDRRSSRLTNSKRSVTMGDRTVLLEPLPEDMSCTLDGHWWLDYFHFLYDRDLPYESE